VGCPGAPTVLTPLRCENGGGPLIPSGDSPIANITDGTANTLLIAEIKVLPEHLPDTQWGGPFSDTTTALGGQTFTGWRTPNSPLKDCIARQFPPDVIPEELYLRQGIPGRPDVPPPPGTRFLPEHSDASKQQFQVARSHHVGGVNASRCDASVKFYSDSVDPYVWNALSSSAGDEAVSEVP
jgi:hypothetical protein